MYRKSKSMFGKLLLLLLTLCCAIVLLFGLAACSETKGIASAVINDNGELVITYTDGTSDNLGVVVGEKGDKGEQGEQGPQGDKGEQGEDGRGISKVEFSADGTKLVITYTDNTTQEIAIPAYGTQCSHEKVECLVFKEHTSEVAGTYLLVCEDCGYSEVLHEFRHDYGDVEVVPPTCEEEGYTGKTCTICGHAADKTDVKEPLGHDWSEEYYVVEDGRTICEDGGMYVRVCSRCDLVESKVTEPIGHRCEDWAVSTTPTAKNAGELKGSCENCGKQQTKTLPAFDSEEGKAFYTYTVTQEKKYCTDEGKGTYSFEIDEQSFSFEVTIAPTQHTLNGKTATEWLNKSENAYSVDITGIKEFPDDHATCTKHGKGYYTCEECGEIVYVDTYKEHTVAQWTDKEGEKATCDDAGKQIGYCSVCETEVERDVPALGHSYTYRIVKESDNTFTLIGTCSTDKSHTTEEKGLTDVKQETTPATCTQEGLIVYTYVKDGVELTIEEPISKLPHTLNGNPATDYANDDKDGAYDADMEGILEFAGDEASCANGGTYGKGYYICEECGELVYVETYRKHVYDTFTDTYTNDDPCTQEGTRTYTCSVCEKQYTEKLPAKGHVYVEDSRTLPTNEKTGTVVISCEREGCSEKITITLPILTDNSYKKQVIVEAACNKEGLIRYTYEYKVGEKVEYTVTFDIVVGMTDHEQSEDAKTYTWIVDGVKYTGYICETCDKMIVTDSEPVEDAA